MTVTLIPWIVVLVFGGVFAYAAIREIRHRRAHGPPDNPRDAFDFDEAAPSYQEPEDPQPADEAPDREATDEDKEDVTARPREGDPKDKDPDCPDTPDTQDRNEAPR